MLVSAQVVGFTADTIRMVSFEKVRMEDELWQPLIHKLAVKTLPHAFKESEVAEKSARHVNEVFFVGGNPNYNDGKPVMQAPGHQEIELGLIKLYNYTGNELYRDMTQRFLDIRGVTFIPYDKKINAAEYSQQHKPVAEQRKAVGHAVRATYLYAAMAEMDSLSGTDKYSQALNAIWHDIVDTKMHISGGLGAVAGIEGFGPSYALPNKETYLETCAAVGNVFFNMRMFLKYRDTKFIDVAEVALLNNCLSGVGLDGVSFFYPNPLECDCGYKVLVNGTQWNPDGGGEVAEASIYEIKEGVLTRLPGAEIPVREATEETFKPAILKIIPYYAWSNRDCSSMMVWFGTKREMAVPGIK